MEYGLGVVRVGSYDIHKVDMNYFPPEEWLKRNVTRMKKRVGLSPVGRQPAKKQQKGRRFHAAPKGRIALI
ncbi:MAG TPA: hypothetical protein DCL13_05780, partial [Peptococcaceae bacterium]|nr:hypothetical protein [Peptococcaceae bacterium]